MRVLTWLFNVLLFILALGFALSNTDTVELHFMLAGLAWRAPLVVFLLMFMVAGVALGLLAAVPSLYRQRREIARLGRELRHASRPASAAAPSAHPVVPVPPGTTADVAAGLGI